MSLHFPDDLFRLNLAFEPSERIFQRLAFLQTHFSQIASSSRANVNQALLQLTARGRRAGGPAISGRALRFTQPKMPGPVFEGEECF